MIEIKFRAWDSKNGVMHNVAFPTNDGIIAYKTKEDAEKDRMASYFEEHRARLIQYTGLNDSEEQEIYEGDIVTDHYKKYEVVYNKETAGFDLRSKKGSLEPLSQFKANSLVKLGNKFENLELME